jgi:succinyl-CoA synthetase alpha subunit
LLADIGIGGDQVEKATANDLIVAIIAEEQAVIHRLISELDTRLLSLSGPRKPSSYRSIDEAVKANPDTNLAVISVPGEYATREARKALDLGKHVFLFSNNVPLEQEIGLKRLAQQRGLLVMGPDCGTSIINGVGIGFANILRRGPIGVVGPAGTGLQEFTSLVHQAGSGISHAIGTGSRDLSDSVGGATALMALKTLDADPATKVIVVISKPILSETLQKVLAAVQNSNKPVIGCFLGLERPIKRAGKNFTYARHIDEAVQLALAKVGFITNIVPSRQEESLQKLIHQEQSSWRPEQRYLRGLFAGGTLCYQSQQILRDEGIPVYSNSPLDKRYRLEKPDISREHSLVDLGDDFFTRGRPHPMIDAGERRKRLLREAADPEVAVILLDFILGYVASPDPVGDLLETIQKAKDTAARRGGHLTVVASVCGTDLDPQNMIQQKSALERAGVIVFSSNARAAQFCVKILRAAKGEPYGN